MTVSGRTKTNRPLPFHSLPMGGRPKGVFQYHGATTGRFSSRGTPMFEVGDWVMWTTSWPASAGCAPMIPRVARVSKITQDRPWGSHTYRLRLREPVEGPTLRVWASLGELRPLGVVDLLAQLASERTLL